MDPLQANRNLELIRTLMERTTQYQLLTARAGLAAGCLAGIGALTFLLLDAGNPWHFGAVWAVVFAGSLTATLIGTNTAELTADACAPARQGTRRSTPSLFAAMAMTIFFFARGGEEYLWLPGIWMLCYGQGALATAAYAPRPIRALGVAALFLGGITLWLGPAWSIWMMGLVFGLGHIGLGVVLLVAERREGAVRLHRSVA